MTMEDHNFKNFGKMKRVRVNDLLCGNPICVKKFNWIGHLRVFLSAPSYLYWLTQNFDATILVE